MRISDWSSDVCSSDLTLLALVMAIGLVVDDAIVVLENIYYRIERGETPLVAAYEGARQVAFAVIATTAVVCAVFVPIMFLAGNTRSEERRVGKEWVSTGRYRGSLYT